MNKIVGIFRNQRQADRVVEALNEMDIDKDAFILSRGRGRG